MCSSPPPLPLCVGLCARHLSCLRAIAATPPRQSPKSIALRKIVADQFRANKDVKDPATLHRLKSTCV